MRVRAAVEKDPILNAIHLALTSQSASPDDSRKELPPAVWRDLKEGKYHVLGDNLYRRNGVTCTIVVLKPALQTHLLDASHDHFIAGHFGKDRTLDRVRHVAWWPKVMESAATYCSSCKSCQLAKRATCKRAGLLQGLDSPSQPWDYVHIDFVTALPPGGPMGYDAILVFTCRISKCIMHQTHSHTWDSRQEADGSALRTSCVSEHRSPSSVHQRQSPQLWEYLLADLTCHPLSTDQLGHHPPSTGRRLGGTSHQHAGKSPPRLLRIRFDA